MIEFKKSSYSTDAGACVEVSIGDIVFVRDSKNPQGEVLKFVTDAWRNFISDIKENKFEKMV